MKQGWEIKKLGEVAVVSSGNSAPQKEELFENGIYPFIRTSDVGQIRKGFIRFCNDYLNEDGVKGLKLYKKGTILFPKSGASTFLNHRVMMEIDGYVSSHLATIKGNNSIIDDRFLLYFLTTIDARNLMQDIAYPSLKTSEISLIPIPYPPLPEQQRIVAILDEAFAAIAKAKANAEQNLKNAKELFESYLQGVFEKKGKMSESGLIGLKDEQDLKSNQKKILKFSNLENPDSDNGEGWEEKTLKEVCAKITDGTHQTPKYFDDGVIFLSSKNVTSGKIDWDNIKYIDEKQHLEMHKRVAPKVGDILLAKNGTTGVAAMVDRDLVFDIYVSLAHIRVLDEVTPDFMLYFINSPVAKKQFNKRLKGSGVPNLHLEEIREVVIPFPKSIKEQNKIVQKLNDFSSESKKLEAIYQQKINDLEELKKSVLQKAFSGELETEKTHHK